MFKPILVLFGILLNSLSTWIALAGTIAYILPSGGSVSFLYGFIFCVLCNLALAASLGELAAIWPTAGGQYHFMYALCTDRWKRPMVSTILYDQHTGDILTGLNRASTLAGQTLLAGLLL